jgi:hypothetical protein
MDRIAEIRKTTQRTMKNLLIVGMLFIAISSFGQAGSVEVDKEKLDSLLETIKKDKKKFDTLEEKFSEMDLIFEPIINETGLKAIEIKHADRLLFIYYVDSKTYKITEIIDWR